MNEEEPVTRKDLVHMEQSILNHDREMEERLFKRIVDHVDERAEQTETKLLAAFHGWARSMEIRVR